MNAFIIVDFKLKQEQTDELNLSRFAFKSISAEEFIAYGENEPICEDLTRP